MAETCAFIIAFTVVFAATVYLLNGSSLQSDLYEEPPPHNLHGPRYRYDADGFARDMSHPIVLRMKRDPNATYSYENMKRQLERQGIDDNPNECYQLFVSPAAEAQYWAEVSRRRREWARQMSAIELNGLDTDAFW